MTEAAKEVLKAAAGRGVRQGARCHGRCVSNPSGNPPIGEDSLESFPNGLVLGSHGGDAGNSTSMSSGSGDGELKPEVEESMLRRRLHGVEGFGLTG